MSDDKKSLSLKESWTVPLGKALKLGETLEPGGFLNTTSLGMHCL